MSDIAIIKTGGKQYKVEVGSTIKVEKIDQEGEIEFDDILLGKKVKATIVEQGRHDKIEVLKFHSKKRYQRLMGHKQFYTKLKIEAIS